MRDEAGNKVVLHGVADSPDPSDNNLYWGIVANDDSIDACLNYFEKIFTAITDKSQGCYTNVFRLHLDPVWTNNPNIKSDGNYLGDADISCFSASRLKVYMKSLYWKIIERAMAHGLYVVVRPPGTCHGTIYVNGEYQDYLKDVWDIVTNNDSIKKYSGQISFELANEPVSVLDENGEVSESAITDFFQPIINIIRENGFDGIIWVPGKTWSADYRSYVEYPISDNNFGFAVHNYSGWFLITDDNCDHDLAINSFREYVPVVRTNPILITEVDWSPEKEGTGHYDNNGNWVLSNYGTWGTASTSKWGMAYKAILDYYDNVGMIAAST
ncbi:MAG: glycoside hydrolase family 5 protein, partial [Bacteroidaceae bacterium]|nr:glycoside hydrolase family 5 protein [Bacteroidaceae bacterium]